MEYLSFMIPLFSVKLTSVPNVVMLNPIKRYTHWLHTCWPAGVVEKLPESGEFGATNIPGVRIVGDLTGIPLLKFSSKTGAEAVRAILQEPDFVAGGVDPVAQAGARESRDQRPRLQLMKCSISRSSVAACPVCRRRSKQRKPG